MIDANICSPDDICENCAERPTDRHLYRVGLQPMSVCRTCYVDCVRDVVLRVQAEFQHVDPLRLHAWRATREAMPRSLPWSLYDDAIESLRLDFPEDQP